MGGNAVLDLRLLGWGRGIPLAPLEKLFPVMWIGFWVNAISGVALFVGDATTKGTTWVFMTKLGIIVVGVVLRWRSSEGVQARGIRRRRNADEPGACRGLAGAVVPGDRHWPLYGLRVNGECDERNARSLCGLASGNVDLGSHSRRPWLWPLCEILHFFGLSLLIGIAGFFDLRLLGFMKRVPISAAWTLMPWAKAGFALAALTGVTFFIGAPDQYINNPAFYAKVFFLIVANLNAVYFEALYRRQIEAKALDAAGRSQ